MSSSHSNLPAPEKIVIAVERELRQIGIPPRPSILDRIRTEMEKEEPAFKLLANAIGSDVSLSAGLIKTANSPYIGLRSRVRSVGEALMALGLNVTSHTIAGLALKKIFPNTPSLDRFWGFSTRIANTAGWLARRVGDIRADDAHTFGLFRDCGIPVLMLPFPKEYPAILHTANDDAESSFTEIEDSLLGTNHATIGAELAESWLLPQDISLAIAHHHDFSALLPASPLPKVTQDLIAVSQLAEHLIQVHTRLSHTQEWHKVGQACRAYLDISDDLLKELYAESAEVVADET